MADYIPREAAISRAFTTRSGFVGSVDVRKRKGRRDMYIDVMCSCCGNHQKLSNAKIQDTVDLIHSGWGSCGSALYCPECSKSWKERNGNRPMGDERNTFIVVMNLFFDAKREEEGE